MEDAGTEMSSNPTSSLVKGKETASKSVLTPCDIDLRATESKVIAATRFQDAYCQKLIKTLLIDSSFVAMGLAEAIKGPTLLDLQDLFETTLSTITYLFIVRSIGSIIGSFTAGLLLENFPKYRFLLLFAWTSIIGVGNALLPFSGSLPTFFFICVLLGWSTGSLDTGGNKLCLDIWNGEANGGPYMHSIHFAFAVGCFIAPVISEPFLSRTKELESEINETISNSFISDISTDVPDISEENASSGMKVLYPIVGTMTMLISIGYFIYGIKEFKEGKIDNKMSEENGLEMSSPNTKANCDLKRRQESLKRVLVMLLLGFIFLYVGMEVMYGTFVATFAVKSSLKLTRQEGARVNSIFWGSFAAMRFSAIFIAFKLSALSQMVLSFTLCSLGSIALAIAGNIYKNILCISSALMGTGMASVYACGILWIEQHITVTGRIVSAMIISGSIGADLFPIILGQFMATFPMILMYLQVAVVLMCILLFSIAYKVTRILKCDRNLNT